MLRINIETRPIRLEYNINNAQLNLKTTPPLVQMETRPPKVEIQQSPGELSIDYTPFYYSIGLKNISDFARDNAAFGRQTASEGIARIVEDGNQMAQIQNTTNVLAELAANSLQAKPVEITWAPIVAPEIRYQANAPQIEVIPGKVNYTFQRGSVRGDYQSGNVDFQVTQYPSVKLSTVDVRV